MPEEKRIVTVLFLFTALFLLAAEVIFFNHASASDSEVHRHAQPGLERVHSKPESSEPYPQSILSTSYKRYSLCRYGNNFVLCEPYTVQHGDWVYKIFRTKGELSKEDFGLFIRIFRDINPEIKNIDSIRPGERITIPLKKSKQNDFKETLPGVVELPTITLSNPSDKLKTPDKTVEENISSADVPLKEAPSVEPEKEKHMPEKMLFATSSKAIASERRVSFEEKIPVSQLKKFAMLNNGQLMLKGKYYFPRNKGDDLVIDVAINPLIQLENGSRILFVPEKDAFASVTDTIRSFWGNLKIMEFRDISQSVVSESQSLEYDNKVLNKKRVSVNQSLPVEPRDYSYVPVNMAIDRNHRIAVKQLLDIAGYTYTPEKEITIPVGNISIKATTGIITKEDGSDILVVFGDIYGSAFESLRKIKQGGIITISPLLTSMDIARKLFLTLGASITDNPAFVNPADGKTVSIDGVYVRTDINELFITQKPVLLKEAFKFLSDKKIAILRFDSLI